MNARVKTILALTMMAGLLMATYAAAQRPPGRVYYRYSYGRPYYGAYYRPYYGGYGYHSSTAAEGYLRGRAAWLRAAGEYNRDTAEAAIRWQDAYGKYMENRKKAVDTYFQMRQMNAKYRAEERKPPPTPEQIERYAKALLPDRPAASELNRLTGEIVWPAELQGEEYAVHRMEMEQAFAERGPGNSGIGSASQAAIAEAAEGMKEVLKEKVKQMPPGQYVAAKKLLNELAYEARFPISPGTQVAAK